MALLSISVLELTVYLTKAVTSAVRHMFIFCYRALLLVVRKLIICGSFLPSLIWREERRLRVFESRVLRGIFGPKRDEVTGEWRKFHNVELNDLYSLPNIGRVIKSRRMRWAWHIARFGGGEGRF
jgi:hypothetical protein